MIPTENQKDMAIEALRVLSTNRLVYIAAEERTGKTLASILVAERILIAKKVLVVTTAKAITGWEHTLSKYKHTKEYVITSYTKLNDNSFSLYKDVDMVILDESHKFISAYPKPSITYKRLATITKNKIVMFLSATPSSQSYAQLFHQLNLSSWSPTRRYANFYKWFNYYGIPECIKIGSRFINSYDKVKDIAYKDVEHLFVRRTRLQAGLTIEPDDVIHYVALSESTLAIYKEIQNNIFRYNDNVYPIESCMERVTKLHMLESGTSKLGEEYLVLDNTEKIDYILNLFGDSKDLVIFYNYKAELLKLKKYFKNAFLAQATSYAEGVDFSKYRHMVVLSMDFSTARYSQRRNRQANINRIEEIKVHYLLTKGTVSEQVYSTVAINKKNFIDSYYRSI